jgi:hypothetical protein
MCAKNVIIGNVCALHIEPSLFRFLSPLIVLSHSFQIRRQFFVLWWFRFVFLPRSSAPVDPLFVPINYFFLSPPTAFDG